MRSPLLPLIAAAASFSISVYADCPSATHVAAPVPIQVTYECTGTAKIYFRRQIEDATKGIKVDGFPKIENTELAILNAQGLPEFLVLPDVAVCGCLPDDQVYFQQFSASGVKKWYAMPGQHHFALSDGSGQLDCQITLAGVSFLSGY